MAVKVYLSAGLGNQLFMIFAVLSYAIDKNIPYQIISFWNKTTNGTKTYWDTFLDSFKNNIDANVKEISEYENVYKEPVFSYVPIEIKDDTVINGYFQSYKYFEHNFEKICDIMHLNEKISFVRNENKHLFNRKTIALHFRFGDYLFLQNYHCIKTPIYYIEAIKELNRKLTERGDSILEYDILYFCQKTDKEIVDKYLHLMNNILPYQLNFVKVPDEIDDWKQMLLMSVCDHFIIANSSFSWFGAYFSQNKDKIVYRPKQWFGPANSSLDTKDMCPDNWNVIDI